MGNSRRLTSRWQKRNSMLTIKTPKMNSRAMNSMTNTVKTPNTNASGHTLRHRSSRPSMISDIQALLEMTLKIVELIMKGPLPACVP